MNGEDNMGLNRIIIIAVFIVTVSGCMNINQKKFSKSINKSLKYKNEIINEVCKKEDLLCHFPRGKKANYGLLCFTGPASPPNCEHGAQISEVFLSCKLDAKLTSGIDSICFKTKYFDDNSFIIHTSELKRSLFPVEKCNFSVFGKLPMPYFEDYDFGLGKNQIRKDTLGECYVETIYTVPSDLEVFVIQAEAGNFWRENCHEKRPKELKEWQNGYSRGFAISEEKNIIVFWTIIW